MVTNAKGIIEKIEQSYKDVRDLCQNVPISALTEPVFPNGWSVKDTLAHLAAWDWRCAELLDVAHHSDVPLKAHPVVDALNLEIYQERQHWSWEEVEFDFQEANQALIESIRALPFERLKDEIVQDSIAEETWEHYQQHLGELKRWRKKVTNRVARPNR